jgi:hypothetical protein
MHARKAGGYESVGWSVSTRRDALPSLPPRNKLNPKTLPAGMAMRLGTGLMPTKSGLKTSPAAALV